jgi:hypothetical protein
MVIICRVPCRQQMLTQLLSGTTLVVDRYAFSGVAYSAAKGNPRMDVAVSTIRGYVQSRLQKLQVIADASRVWRQRQGACLLLAAAVVQGLR